MNIVGTMASDAWKMAGKAATSTIGKRVIGGGAIGGVMGAVAGSAWDYNPSGGFVTGAMLGAAGGAAMGSRAVGITGFKDTAKATSRYLGRHGAGMAVGGVIGGMTGPSDSTFANIGMGVSAGLIGSMGSRYLAPMIGPRARSFSIGGGNFGTVGLYNRKVGLSIGKFDKSMSVGALGAGASALFAPHMAHGLIGMTRRDKKQNSFNRY
jgi:hypothetical protein